MGKVAKDMGGLRVLLRALLVWGICALCLLTASSLVLSKVNAGSELLGYFSSAISFLSALAAAVSISGGKGDRRYLQSVAVALLLVILLLTLGFLAGGRSLNPSGILSVVSFTISGVLVGSLIARKGKGKGRRKRAKSGAMRKFS